MVKTTLSSYKAIPKTLHTLISFSLIGLEKLRVKSKGY
jgi:hypothetical protein